MPGLNLILNAEIRALRQLMAEIEDWPMHHIDLGSGAGCTLPVFPTQPPSICVDQSFLMLRRAFSAWPDILPVAANTLDLPVKSDRFDLISAIGLTEYLQDMDPLFSEIHRIAKLGAWVIITVAPPSFFNYLRLILGHRLYLIPKERWETMIQSRGFSVIARRRTFLQIQFLLQVQNNFL